MGSSATIASLIDLEMLASRSARVYSFLTEIEDMEPRTGSEVFTELGGRYLLHYTSYSDRGFYLRGLLPRTFATPTAAPAHDLDALLALPGPRARTHVLFIDPRQGVDVRGPRLVRLGRGIEYVLMTPAPFAALVPPRWPVPVS
jgi:hypothetical protein